MRHIKWEKEKWGDKEKKTTSREMFHFKSPARVETKPRKRELIKSKKQ